MTEKLHVPLARTPVNERVALPLKVTVTVTPSSWNEVVPVIAPLAAMVPVPVVSREPAGKVAVIAPSEITAWNDVAVTVDFVCLPFVVVTVEPMYVPV